MNKETKMYLFEKTYALEAQKKEAEALSEYDPVRCEIERRYHHNLDKIVMNLLLTEYESYRKERERK